MTYFRIKEACQEKGITLKGLEAMTGITHSNIVNMANGKTWPRLDSLQKIAQALGCKVEDLFNAKPQEERPADGEYLELESDCVQKSLHIHVRPKK